MVGAAGIAALTYLRHEPAGRGRPLLISLRAASLVLIVLLLLDPLVHIRPATRSSSRVILDGSLSMLVGDSWSRGVAAARKSAGRDAVMLFGTDVRLARPDSLAVLRPYAGASRLLPALQSAAEAGAERVTVITDGNIEDPDEVRRWLPALNLEIRFENVARPMPPNRAIRDVEAPAWAEAGKPVTLRIHTRSTSSAGTAVVVTQDGKRVAATNGDSVSFIAHGPREGGFVRYDVAFETHDSIPDDDARSVYVFVAEKPAGVVLVSFDPDWEPRFLHPVLENALGLPVRTFLRVPAGLYFRGGNGAEAGAKVQEADVLRAVRAADFVVLHGLTSAAPDWAQQSALRARRLMIFPGRSGIQEPVRTSGAVDGDWYVSADLPASPISALLAGMDVGSLPPLNSLQSAEAGSAAWAPLVGGRTPHGGRSPLVLAEAHTGGRRAIALGEGYWKWAIRGGAARDAYARLWGALAGWVVQDAARITASSIRPVSRSVARGTALRWLAPGLAADSLAVSMRDAAGNIRSQMVHMEPGDSAQSAALAPGHYHYDVRAFAAGKEIARATGPLTVESYSSEFTRMPVDLKQLERGPRSLAGTSRVQGRALHTFSGLYLLLALLLCAEWILRRRWGLR